MIELVPMAFRVVNEVEEIDSWSEVGKKRRDGTGKGEVVDVEESVERIMDGKVDVKSEREKGDIGVGGKGDGRGRGSGSGSGKMDEDEERDKVFFRLEGLGYRVGQGLVERFSRDRPRFTDTLDVIKFLCKDLWMLVFRKQIDNLKTNHRGVYVLTDNSFRPFARMSTEAGGQAVVRAQPFLWFPCGIIRGALASMGINATVQAETSELPGATFQIKSVVTKP